MDLIRSLGADNALLKNWLKLRAQRLGCGLRCGPYAWDLTKGLRVIRISKQQYARVLSLARDFDELFQALIPTQLGDRRILDFSRLHLHTYRAAKFEFELAQWPEPDAAIESYFEKFQPNADDLVFDIGAECGISTYVLSLYAGRVVALEQDATLRDLLERNMVRHNLKRVTVANGTIDSLAEMIRLHGEPAFCRVNLDLVSPEFLFSDARAWTSRPIFFAARSTSRRVRSAFIAFVRDAGFETAVDKTLGMIWASRGSMMGE